jgi:hypothetical protein
LDLFLFSDASVAVKHGLGFGAFACFEAPDLSLLAEKSKAEISPFLIPKISFCPLPHLNSTQAEIHIFIQSLLFVEKAYGRGQNLVCYTDCQGIISLIESRQQRLQEQGFKTRSGKIHKHALLY